MDWAKKNLVVLFFAEDSSSCFSANILGLSK